MKYKMVRMVSVCMGLFLLSGCRMEGLRKDIAARESYKPISGTVTGIGSSTLPVVVVLWGVGDTDESPSNYQFAQGDGRFRFDENRGTYCLIAFEDGNKDGRFQEGIERAGIYKKGEIIDLAKSESYENLTIELLPPGHIQLPAAASGISKDAVELKFEDRAGMVGQVTQLDDPLFSPKNASLGLWTPLTYLETLGMKLYFLEPYDAQKIPVLFVHGANGHPGNFQTLIEQMDRTRFQPWVVFYPSGARLERLGGVICGMLREAHASYQFEEIVVVAHSMGGLVSRSAVLSYADSTRRARMPLFITFSTPWNGHSAVAMGIKHAPAVVPSWYDMLPDNPFITHLFSQSLPAETRHHLFFSFEGKGGSPFKSQNTDGAVSIESQLSIAAQTQASALIGVPADHVGILSHPFAIEQFNAILQSYAGCGRSGCDWPRP